MKGERKYWIDMAKQEPLSALLNFSLYSEETYANKVIKQAKSSATKVDPDDTEFHIAIEAALKACSVDKSKTYKARNNWERKLEWERQEECKSLEKDVLDQAQEKHLKYEYGPYPLGSGNNKSYWATKEIGIEPRPGTGKTRYYLQEKNSVPNKAEVARWLQTLTDLPWEYDPETSRISFRATPTEEQQIQLNYLKTEAGVTLSQSGGFNSMGYRFISAHEIETPRFILEDGYDFDALKIEAHLAGIPVRKTSSSRRENEYPPEATVGLASPTQQSTLPPAVVSHDEQLTQENMPQKPGKKIRGSGKLKHSDRVSMPKSKGYTID